MWRALSATLLLWSFLAGTAAADSFTITDVTVTSGSYVWNSGNVGWRLPLSLNPGEDVVFTQNCGGFCFDTSDALGTLTRIDVTVNGILTSFFDTDGILNLRGVDPITNEANEAQEYGLPLYGPGYRVFLAYADNTHTDACGSYASSIGLEGAASCLPAPFFDAVYFMGLGIRMPDGLTQTYPWHCNEHGNCFDAGVVRIVVDGERETRGGNPVPEASSLALMALGLFGLVHVVRKRS